MIANSRLRGWILIGALVAVSCVGLGAFVDHRVTEVQVDEAAGELQLLMSLRRGALESYFDTVRSELTFWSLSDALREGVAQLEVGWSAIPDDPETYLRKAYVLENSFEAQGRNLLSKVDDGTAYDDAHADFHELARPFVSERGYYDLFLIDPTGNVIYTVEKELDFATNLNSGAWKDSGLADVFRRALANPGTDTTAFSDFERYEPSAGDPAIFAAIPVVSERGETLGVLALQVPTERIQSIMQFSGGMGRTGETYLVGKDLLMRSNSRFAEEPTTLETRVESDTVRMALDGETGVSFTDDYRGVPVLSAYGTFSYDELTWAVMAEIDRDEVYEEVAQLRLSIPVIGIALYALSLLSVWFVDTDGWSVGDLDMMDPGDPPPM